MLSQLLDPVSPRAPRLSSLLHGRLVEFPLAMQLDGVIVTVTGMLVCCAVIACGLCYVLCPRTRRDGIAKVNVDEDNAPFTAHNAVVEERQPRQMHSELRVEEVTSEDGRAGPEP